jgi:hypothetical protein
VFLTTDEHSAAEPQPNGNDFNAAPLTRERETPRTQRAAKLFPQPRMDTNKPSAAYAATTDFGLRREAKRHAAFGSNRQYGKRCRRCPPSAVCYGGRALCHRSPNLCRPCAKLQNCITDKGETRISRIDANLVGDNSRNSGQAWCSPLSDPCESAYSGVAATRLYAVSTRRARARRGRSVVKNLFRKERCYELALRSQTLNLQLSTLNQP